MRAADLPTDAVNCRARPALVSRGYFETSEILRDRDSWSYMRLWDEADQRQRHAFIRHRRRCPCRDCRRWRETGEEGRR